MLYFSSIISGIILGFFWVTLKSIILEFSSIMYLTLNYMLLLIVTLTLYFNDNEITTHLIHNEIYNKSRKSIFLCGNISR